MRKNILFLLMILFLIFIAPPSCMTSQPATDSYSEIQDERMASSLFPEESYIHLLKIYNANIITGSRVFGTQAAGGACVHSELGGCYVITVNHFCTSEPENIPQTSHFSFSNVATNISGQRSTDITIVDTMPEADLCLLYVRGDFEQVRGIQLDSETQRFERLQNYGAPAGFFTSGERWNLAMHEGRWSGYCNARCAVPDSRIDVTNLINHTIPTTRGQSGSPIFIGDYLFGIQVASNSSIEDFGIAASSTAIYLLLERNGILMERSYGEE